MPISNRPDAREAIIQAKVERALAPWRDKLPLHMERNLRAHAEEYYRTHPLAMRVIDILVGRATPERSEVTRDEAPNGEEAHST